MARGNLIVGVLLPLDLPGHDMHVQYSSLSYYSAQSIENSARHALQRDSRFAQQKRNKVKKIHFHN